MGSFSKYTVKLLGSERVFTWRQYQSVELFSTDKKKEALNFVEQYIEGLKNDKEAFKKSFNDIPWVRLVVYKYQTSDVNGRPIYTEVKTYTLKEQKINFTFFDECTF